MFDRTADQELFEDTTRRFLEAECPLTKVRDLAGTKAGFERDYWRKGAELGWTSLLVPEDAGGGSVSGAGVADLVLVAYEFGLHAAPGPLGPANVAAAALGRWGSPAHHETTLAALMAGEAVGAWAGAEATPSGGLGRVGVEARSEGSTTVLVGSAGPVEAGAEADTFVVAARAGSGLGLYLVPGDAPGLGITPLHGLDMTRRFARVDLDGVKLSPAAAIGGEASDAAGWLGDLAVVVQVAEMVGCMQWAMDTTVDWAFNRYSFGRPLASYQEIKHRFSDMKMWLEASYAIVAEAAAAVDAGADAASRAELVSAAKHYVGRYGGEMLHDCVQLHGGIGVTFDHDLHLFLRRVTTDLPIYGSPAAHAVRITRVIESQAHDDEEARS